MQNEQTLKAALQQRDRNGIREILDEIGPALYGFALRLTESETKAAAVLQATFQKIWKNAATFDDSKGSFFQWVFNFARLAALEARQENDEKIEQFNFAAYQQSHAGRAGLREIFSQMDEKHRKVIEYACFYGMTEQEVEREMNIPVGSVSTRLRLAMKELRPFFEEKNKTKA